MKLIIIRGPAGLDYKPWLLSNLPYAKELTGHETPLGDSTEGKANFYLRVIRPELWYIYPFVNKFAGRFQVSILDLVISPDAYTNEKNLTLVQATRIVQSFVDNPIPEEWAVPVDTLRFSLGGYTPQPASLPDDARDQLLRLREVLAKCATVPQEAKLIAIKIVEKLLNVK